VVNLQEETNTDTYERIGAISKCSRYRGLYGDEYEDSDYAYAGEEYQIKISDFQSSDRSTTSSDNEYEDIREPAPKQDAVRTRERLTHADMTMGWVDPSSVGRIGSGWVRKVVDWVGFSKLVGP